MVLADPQYYAGGGQPDPQARIGEEAVHRGARSAVAEFLSPVPELLFDDQVVAAGHGLEQLGAHGCCGGEAGRGAHHRKASRTRAAVSGWRSE
ncbi:hypothetical protein [Streptomyces mirabilis]|uniref:hypothetical protein n=1 Tax=Streptomyces mirabilis TaxID=68239 RepID=UPI0036B454D1